MPFKFKRPGSGKVGFVKDDHENHLLAFVGVTYEEQVSTSFGDSDAARVDTVVCIDCPYVITDVMIFGAALVPRLTEGTAEDDIVLGRLVKGESKPGRNAPWLLEDPTPEDEEKAEKFFDAYASQLKSGRVVVEVPADEKF